MIPYSLSDWTAAYTVGAHIVDADQYPARWSADAAAFRDDLVRQGRAMLDQAFGSDPLQTYDVFLPKSEPKGLFVFIHGGYWKAFDKSQWSHFTEGALANGFAAGVPSYRLCPRVRVSEIVADTATAISTLASRISGPIYLAGHSAGGHLCTRLIAKPSPLTDNVSARIVRCLSIAGLHDLRPIMRAEMNAILRIDEQEAIAHSPALLAPVENKEVICWVGGTERHEFLRQNALLANVWGGIGAKTFVYEEPDRHHFNIIDSLRTSDSEMMRALLR